jgi:hypothetical protein
MSPAPTSPAAAPSNPQLTARKDHKSEKPERVRVSDKPPVAPKGEAKTEQPPTRAAGGAPDAVAAQPAAASAAQAPESEYGLASALKGFGSRLLPSRDRVPVPEQDAVRPPLPVGDL